MITITDLQPGDRIFLAIPRYEGHVNYPDPADHVRNILAKTNTVTISPEPEEPIYFLRIRNANYDPCTILEQLIPPHARLSLMSARRNHIPLDSIASRQGDSK